MSTGGRKARKIKKKSLILFFYFALLYFLKGSGNQLTAPQEGQSCIITISLKTDHPSLLMVTFMCLGKALKFAFIIMSKV